MTVPRRHIPASLVLAGLAAVGLWTTTAPTAAAEGHDGICTDEHGVTVVVDPQDLGGPVVVRCAPDFPAGGTGLDALHLAGFTPAGTLREGASFICRIDGRPAADEALSVAGQTYREDCVVTPPDWAFWSYWHAAGDADEWTQSSMGAARSVTPGGFEGWSFSLGQATGTNPPPGLDLTAPASIPAAEPSAPGTEVPQVSDTPPGATGTLVSVTGLGLLAGAAALVWWRRRSAS